MTQQLINLGSVANDGTGTPLRDAGEMINENFTELYDRSLDELSDVAISAPVDGDALIYDASFSPPIWREGTPSIALSELEDVDFADSPSPADGDFLSYESTASPGAWKHVTPSEARDILDVYSTGEVDALIGGGSGSLDGLSDVDLTSSPVPQDGDVLTYDGSVSPGVWRPEAPVAAGAGALQLITETVTSGTAADVTFSSIATTWRDLVVVVRGRGSTAAVAVNMVLQFNGDTGANYDYEYINAQNTTLGGAGTVATTSAFIGQITAASGTANVAGSCRAEILDYRGTTFQKAGTFHSNGKSGTTTSTIIPWLGIFNWRSTSAINAVKVFPAAGAFVDNSVVSLYGRM
jgi:hypothetical protein